MNAQRFSGAMKDAGWAQVAQMGTHTHALANEHGVECNIGLDAHAGKLELELVDSEQDISVLLSVEPASAAGFEDALAHIVAGMPAVEPTAIMAFAKGLAKVCPVYAEPSQITVDAGYEHDEGSEDWIRLAGE